MDPFLIRLILSFFVGAVWVTLISIAAERFGTKAGGAIAGIPATMVISLLFIGITQTPAIAAAATTVVPIVVGMNAIYVVIYIVLLRYGFALSMFLVNLLWFAGAYVVLCSNIAHYAYALTGFVLLVLFSYIVLEKMMHITSAVKVSMRYTVSEIALRAFISGATIAAAVLMAHYSGPILGGIFASFPALTVSLMIITYRNHGADYSSSLFKNFILAGSVNVIVYTTAVRYLYTEIGLWIGTALAIVLSLMSVYITYHLINKRLA